MTMRYFVIILLGVLSVIISGSVAPLMGAIRVDIVLLLIMSIALAEKPALPVAFAAATGLFMDVMYSTNFGMHALSYTIIAIGAQVLFGNIKKVNILTVLIAGVTGFILNDFITGIFAYAQGARFVVTDMVLYSILPSAILNGVLLIVACFFVSKLFNKNWMRRKSRRGDDFGHIG